MSFEGSCHCGKIRFTVDEPLPTRAMDCNCSICRRKGYLHHFTTPDRFTLNSARDEIQVYEWNKRVIRHQFCKTCGCAPFAEGMGPQGPAAVINLRCVPEVDLDSLEIERFDGANLL